MKLLKVVLIFILIGLSVSETFAQKETIEVPEDKALVYILRPSIFGFAIKMKIDCDGKYIGATTAKRYIYHFVDAGEHTFSCETEAIDEIVYDFKAGETYYIKQSINPGVIMARSNFLLIDKTEAEKLFKKCKLSKHQVK